MRLMFGLALAAAFVGPAHCQPSDNHGRPEVPDGLLGARGQRTHGSRSTGSRRPAGSLHGRQPHRCGRQDRRAYEFLQIRDLPEGVTYIAKPSNQPEARFVAVLQAPPTKSSSRTPRTTFRSGFAIASTRPTALRARIEGMLNGKARGIDFPFSRTACMP